MEKKSILAGYKNSLILLLWLVFTTALFGQRNYFDGYIIKNNNDTVFGLIKLEKFSQNAMECNFKMELNSKVEKYYPEDLLGYRFNEGKYYVSEKISYRPNSERFKKFERVEFDRAAGTFYRMDEAYDEMNPDFSDKDRIGIINKQVFLEFIIDGIVDIFAYYDSTNTPVYFIRKDADSLLCLENTSGIAYNQYNDDYEIEKKEYIGLLTYLLSDCENIALKVAETYLSNESLIKLAKYYHYETCTDPNEACIVHEKVNRRVHVSIIPNASYSKLHISPSNLHRALEQNFTNQNKTSFGINIKFSNFQNINHHLATSVGLNIQDQNLISEDSVVGLTLKVKELPMAFQYTFLSNSRIQPHLGILLSPYLRKNLTIESATMNTYLLLDKFKTRGVNFGAFVGLDCYLNKKKTLFISLAAQYKLWGKYYNLANNRDNSKSSSIAIQVGLGYILNE